jgi:hypothetical protein
VSQPNDEYLVSLKKRYAKATKKERGKILDEYVKTTACHRKHASAVLSGKRKRVKRPIRRPRRTTYTAEDARAIEEISGIFDGINSKLLRVAMDNELAHLYENGQVAMSPDSYERLKHISAATMDRLRARHGRRGAAARRRGRTKPGTLLKQQIPIRTWADWNEDRPGFTEMDLVAHDGGNPRGDHVWTLDFIDIKTGWTECAAVPNKAQIHVFAAIRVVRSRLPFPLLGVDSDNGSEFINNELVRYCDQEHLTFTRSREGHKNDNAYVEQKNWTAVRRLVGDLRFDTPEQLAWLNELYECLHLYLNFFVPIMRLKEKVRVGSKVKRVYDTPQTPYARTLVSPHISKVVKAKLRLAYKHLDVVELKRTIDRLVDLLWADEHRS